MRADTVDSYRSEQGLVSGLMYNKQQWLRLVNDYQLLTNISAVYSSSHVEMHESLTTTSRRVASAMRIFNASS
jgi:hypothetical protein